MNDFEFKDVYRIERLFVILDHQDWKAMKIAVI